MVFLHFAYIFIKHWSSEYFKVRITIVYINFHSRKVFALVDDKETPNPLDWKVSGPSVLFLVIDVFLYWLIIVMFETNTFTYLRDKVFCRRRQ